MEGLSNLGIDFKTILFYIINIGLFVVVLWYLLYEPIIKLLSKRQKSISDTLDEANKVKAEFEKKIAAMTDMELELQAKIKSEMQEAEKFIEQKKASMLAELEEQRTQLIAKANQEITTRKQQLVKETEKQLLDIIKKMILEIVYHKVPDQVIQDSVQEAWQKYNK